MGNAPSAPAPSPSTPRTSKSQPRSLPTSPAKSSSPSPTPVSAPVKPKELEPVLRPNRKSIELPGLNSFGPTPPPTSSRMRVSSRIVDRGRTWLHREGRSTNGSNPNGSFTANANGRGRGPQTKSAAIAIPSGRRPGWDDDDERETGYGRHVQEGIARRKAEKAKEAEEQQRRRGRSRSRHDDDHLRAPSPSRSTSHSNSPSHSRSRSPSRSQSRGGDSADPRHRAPYPSPDDRVYEMRERNRAALEAAAERARAQERLFGADTAHSSTAYQEEVIFSTIPLTIGPATFVGAAEGDGDLDDEDGEGDGARSRAVAAMVDEIIGPNPPPPQLTAVDIAWRGQGTSVALIRAGDKDWQNPTELDKASPDSSFTTTILLPAGTHHFRFVVDGLIVVAPSNEIANAVDDQGFITNYVTVPGPAVTASAMPTTSTPLPVLSMAANKPPPVTLGRSTSGRNKQRRPSLPVHPDGSFWDHNSVDGSEDARGRVGERGSRPHGKGKSTAAWTTEIPEELFAAAKQEEDWLSAQSEHQHHNHTRHLERGRHAGIALNGFPVEPTIPLAAKLPRHLERLILNRPSPGVVIPRVGTGAGNVGLSTVISPYGSGHLNGSPALRVTTASGTDVTMPPHSMMMGMASLTPSSHPPSPTPLKESPGATGGTPLIADDPSVLQTPSHAVLYHLCTSSIRDKMIAVGASTRYRQKYLTTVYYKPAEPGVWEE